MTSEIQDLLDNLELVPRIKFSNFMDKHPDVFTVYYYPEEINKVEITAFIKDDSSTHGNSDIRFDSHIFYESLDFYVYDSLELFKHFCVNTNSLQGSISLLSKYLGTVGNFSLGKLYSECNVSFNHSVLNFYYRNLYYRNFQNVRQLSNFWYQIFIEIDKSVNKSHYSPAPFKDAIALNEFIHDKSIDSSMTFREYIEIPRIKKLRNNYVNDITLLNIYAKTQEVFSLFRVNNYCSLNFKKGSAFRELLLDYDKTKWQRIVEVGGTTLTGRNNFLNFLKVTIDQNDDIEKEIENIRSSFIFLFSKKITESLSEVSTLKIHPLTVEFLESIPKEEQIKVHYKDLGEIIKTLLGKTSELSLLDIFTITQMFNKSGYWVSGTSVDSFAFLYNLIVKEENINFLKFIARTVREHKGTMPTMKEWKDFEYSEEFLDLPVSISITLVKKNNIGDEKKYDLDSFV